MCPFGTQGKGAGERYQGAVTEGRGMEVSKAQMLAFLGVCSVLWGPLIEAGELPPPPASLEAVADAQLYLELVINQMNTGRLVHVQQRAGQLYLQANVLQEAGIHLPVTPPEEVGLDSVPGCTASTTFRPSACCWMCRPTGCPSKCWAGARLTRAPTP